MSPLEKMALQNAYVPFGDKIWGSMTESFVAPLDFDMRAEIC